MAVQVRPPSAEDSPASVPPGRVKALASSDRIASLKRIVSRVLWPAASSASASVSVAEGGVTSLGVTAMAMLLVALSAPPLPLLPWSSVTIRKVAGPT